jgi:AraC-like DNA-binding protein
MREIVEGLAERHSESAGTPPEQKYDLARINRALQYLEENYDQRRSLNKLADVSSFSTSHFLRTFTRVVGLTPLAYLTQFRIEAAASLLRTGVAIAEVAAAVGFTDQSHLTKRFKSILGVTPGQYTPKSDPSPRRDLRRNLLIRRCFTRRGVKNNDRGHFNYEKKNASYDKEISVAIAGLYFNIVRRGTNRAG